MYEKIKNILSKEIKEDINKYKEMRYRKDLLKSISFEERITRVLGLSTIFYLGLFAVLVVLMELSPLIFPFLMVGSVSGSVLLDRFILKKFNNKKRVQEFTNARKNIEVEEEIIKYEFEMEKVVSKIKVNEEALSIILNKSEMYDKLSGDYELFRKNDDSFSKKEISRLNEKTLENYNKLNKFSRRKVIEEKLGSTEVVKQEVYVSEETIIKEDVNRLGLKKRYPN